MYRNLLRIKPLYKNVQIKINTILIKYRYKNINKIYFKI